jgi:hypothetical protein
MNLFDRIKSESVCDSLSDTVLKERIDNLFLNYDEKIINFEKEEKIYNEKFIDDEDFLNVLSTVGIKKEQYLKEINSKKIYLSEGLIKEISAYLLSVYNVKFEYSIEEEKLYSENYSKRREIYYGDYKGVKYDVPFIQLSKEKIIDSIKALGDLNTQKHNNIIHDFVNQIQTIWSGSDKPMNCDLSYKSRIDLQLIWKIWKEDSYGSKKEAASMTKPVYIGYSNREDIYTAMKKLCDAINLISGEIYHNPSNLFYYNRNATYLDIGINYDGFVGKALDMFSKIKINKSGMFNIWFKKEEYKQEFIQMFHLVCKSTVGSKNAL